jgi:rhamnogalacturonyl hydrolase YesR
MFFLTNPVYANATNVTIKTLIQIKVKTMIRFFFLASGVLLMNVSMLFAESNPEKLIRIVPDYILGHNAYGFVNTKTGEVFPDAGHLNSPENIDFLSHYNGWQYRHGVLNMAMLDLYENTKEKKYFNQAAKQVIHFHKHLFCTKTELYYQNYYSDTKQNGVAHWGRCNGWIMMAQVNLFEFLPEDHPKRDTFLSILKEQILGLSRHQSKTVLWHQVLNRPDSYLESSCTAMFTYSIAKAINKGWVHERYSTIAEDGWHGLSTMIQSDGQVENICMGTGVENNIKFYYERPTKLNDFHGLGPGIMAGTEMMKLTKNGTNDE